MCVTLAVQYGLIASLELWFCQCVGKIGAHFPNWGVLLGSNLLGHPLLGQKPVLLSGTFSLTGRLLGSINHNRKEIAKYKKFDKIGQRRRTVILTGFLLGKYFFLIGSSRVVADAPGPPSLPKPPTCPKFNFNKKIPRNPCVL